jgi:hypothetical protein
MKGLIFSSLMIAALGASSVFATQNANTASKTTRPPARISGGSTTTAGGAVIGGTAKNVAGKKSVSRTKQHRRVRRRVKKL